MSDATVLLAAMEQGDPQAADKLLEVLYDELRRLAAGKMAQQPPGQTLQATALVHEAWLRLANSENKAFKNRSHFFCAAAEAMRHILIDKARRRKSERRGGRVHKTVLDESEIAAPAAEDQLLALDEALARLATTHPTQVEVVKLRYFVGMTNQEVADLLGISVATVKNYWSFARAWLFTEINSA